MRKEGGDALLDQYRNSLPALSLEQETGLALEYTDRKLKAHDGAVALDKQVPGLEKALDDIDRATKDGPLTATEERDLAPQIKIINDARAKGGEFAADLDFVAAIDSITYARWKAAPIVHGDEDQAKVAGKAGGTPAGQKELYEGGYRLNGLDSTGKALSTPTQDELTRAAAVDVAQMRRSAMVEVTNADRMAYNQKVKAWNDQPGTPEQRQALVDEDDALKVREQDLEAMLGTIKEVGKGLAPPQDLVRRGLLRADDMRYLGADKNSPLSGQLSEWNALQLRAEELQTRLAGSGDPRQAKIAESLKGFGELAGSMYDVHARHVGFRAPGMGIEDASLPSSGRLDMYDSTRAAYNIPSFAKGGPAMGLVEQIAQARGVKVGDMLADTAAKFNAEEFNRSRYLPYSIVRDKLTGKVKEAADDAAKPGAVFEAFDVTVMQKGVAGQVSIVRITNPDGSVTFIDGNGHTYSSRDDFRNNNELLNESDRVFGPKDWAGFLKPSKGEDGTLRAMSDEDRVAGLTEFDLVDGSGDEGRHLTWWDKNKGWVYLGGGLVASALVVVATAGTGSVAVAAAWGAWGVGGATALTAAVDTGIEAVNRVKHNQSLDPIHDAGARAMWLNGVTGVLALPGVALGGAALKAAATAGRVGASAVATPGAKMLATQAAERAAARATAPWVMRTNWTALGLGAGQLGEGAYHYAQDFGDMTIGERWKNGIQLAGFGLLAGHGTYLMAKASKIGPFKPTRSTSTAVEQALPTLLPEDFAARMGMSVPDAMNLAKNSPFLQVADIGGQPVVQLTVQPPNAPKGSPSGPGPTNPGNTGTPPRGSPFGQQGPTNPAGGPRPGGAAQSGPFAPQAPGGRLAIGPGAAGEGAPVVEGGPVAKSGGVVEGQVVEGGQARPVGGGEQPVVGGAPQRPAIEAGPARPQIESGPAVARAARPSIHDTPVDHLVRTTGYTREQVLAEVAADPGLEIVEIDGQLNVRPVEGGDNPFATMNTEPGEQLPDGMSIEDVMAAGEAAVLDSLPVVPSEPRPLRAGRDAVLDLGDGRVTGADASEFIGSLAGRPEYPRSRIVLDARNSYGMTLDAASAAVRGSVAEHPNLESVAVFTADGVVVWTRAAGLRIENLGGRNQAPLNAAERAGVDAVFQEHGKKFLDRPGDRARFLTDPKGYLAGPGRKWADSAVGDSVEVFGAERLRAQLEPGETLLTDVLMWRRMGGVDTKHNQMDFLVVDADGRPVREISAKASKGSLKNGVDEAKLVEFFRAVPETLAEQRTHLAKDPAGYTPAQLESFEGFTVTVNGRPEHMSIAEFRATYVNGVDPASITPEPLMAADPANFGLMIRLNRDQVVDAVVDAGLRHLGSDPVKWAMGGESSRPLHQVLDRLGMLRGRSGPVSAMELLGELGRSGGHRLVPAADGTVRVEQTAAGDPAPARSTGDGAVGRALGDRPGMIAGDVLARVSQERGRPVTMDELAVEIAVHPDYKLVMVGEPATPVVVRRIQGDSGPTMQLDMPAEANRPAVTRLLPGARNAAGITSAVTDAARTSRDVVIDARGSGPVHTAEVARGVQGAAVTGAIDSIAVWTPQGVVRWTAASGITLIPTGPAAAAAPHLPQPGAAPDGFVHVRDPVTGSWTIRPIDGPDGPDGGAAAAPGGDPTPPLDPSGGAGGKLPRPAEGPLDGAPVLPAPNPASPVGSGGTVGMGGGVGGAGGHGSADGAVSGAEPAAHTSTGADGATRSAEVPPRLPGDNSGRSPPPVDGDIDPALDSTDPTIADPVEGSTDQQDPHTTAAPTADPENPAGGASADTGNTTPLDWADFIASADADRQRTRQLAEAALDRAAKVTAKQGGALTDAPAADLSRTGPSRPGGDGTDAGYGDRRAAIERAVADPTGEATKGVVGEDVLAEVIRVLQEQKGITVRPGQITGALALLDGAVVQQLTGQGKTYTLAITAGAHAKASGDQVVVLTLNDQLGRDFIESAGEVLEALGLSVAHMSRNLTTESKAEAAQSDVIVTTYDEHAFDLLRAGLGRGAATLPARLGLVLGDEADFILLDGIHNRARIAAPAKKAAPPIRDLETGAAIASWLAESTVDRPGHFHRTGELAVELTPAGIARIAEIAGSRGTKVSAELLARVRNALVARHLAAEGEHVLIENDAVTAEPVLVLVDRPGGHAQLGRRLDGGLHEALELRFLGAAGVQPPSITVASIPVTRTLTGAPKWAGITGTAGGEQGRAQFLELYEKPVVEVAPDRIGRREDHVHVFEHGTTGRAQMIREVLAAHREGAPVLVMADSIPEVRALVAELEAAVPHLERATAEADVRGRLDEIAALAGMPGALTVATNVFSRGIDILPGGDLGHLAGALGVPEAQLAADVGRYRDAVNAHGGLRVFRLGQPRTSRELAQLGGRTARNGAPGETHLYVSLDGDAPVIGVDRGTAPVVLATRELSGAEADLARQVIAGQETTPKATPERRARALRPLRKSVAPVANELDLDLAALHVLRTRGSLPGIDPAQLPSLWDDAALPVERPLTGTTRAAAERLAGVIPTMPRIERRVALADVRAAVPAAGVRSAAADWAAVVTAAGNTPGFTAAPYAAVAAQLPGRGPVTINATAGPGEVPSLLAGIAQVAAARGADVTVVLTDAHGRTAPVRVRPDGAVDGAGAFAAGSGLPPRLAQQAYDLTQLLDPTEQLPVDDGPRAADERGAVDLRLAPSAVVGAVDGAAVDGSRIPGSRGAVDLRPVAPAGGDRSPRTAAGTGAAGPGGDGPGGQLGIGGLTPQEAGLVAAALGRIGSRVGSGRPVGAAQARGPPAGQHLVGAAELANELVAGGMRPVAAAGLGLRATSADSVTGETATPAHSGLVVPSRPTTNGAGAGDRPASEQMPQDHDQQDPVSDTEAPRDADDGTRATTDGPDDSVGAPRPNEGASDGRGVGARLGEAARTVARGTAMVAIAVALSASAWLGLLSSDAHAAQDGRASISAPASTVETKAGETWPSLAARLPGVTEQGLADANKGVDVGPDGLLPAGAPIAVPVGWTGELVVRPGDTLTAIGARVSRSPLQVAELNDDRFREGGRIDASSMDLIRPGERIVVVPPSALDPGSPEKGEPGTGTPDPDPDPDPDAHPDRPWSRPDHRAGARRAEPAGFGSAAGDRYGWLVGCVADRVAARRRLRPGDARRAARRAAARAGVPARRGVVCAGGGIGG